MKLKLVVASMSLLGLVSGSVFAASTSTNSDMGNTSTSTTTTTNTVTNSSTTPAAARHHHHCRHHGSGPCNCKNQYQYQRQYQRQYQYMDDNNYKGYKGEPICVISQEALTMQAITQNVGRALYDPCRPDWFNRIAVTGGINVDMGKWGNRNANIMGENYQRISLNDIYLNVTASVNDWAEAFASISFSNPTTIADGSIYNNIGAAEYSAAYANNIAGNGNNTVQLEQAYATFGNFAVTPFFLQLGKQFQDFSRYEIHPITRSMTQVMSETLATSAKIGFLVPAGFHGSFFIFDNPINKITSSSTPTNYGVSLGYDQINENFGWDIGGAYLYNMMGVNDVAYNVVNFTQTNGYNSRIAAVAAYADLNAGPFTIGARYTTATQRFNASDLPQNGAADLVGGAIIPGVTSVPVATATGAKPWSAGVQAGYGFDYYMNRNQNVYLGYQTSYQAAGLDLPRHRWLAGYNIDFWKNTNFGIEWDHDTAYSVSHGGTGRTTNLVSLRAAVLFA